MKPTKQNGIEVERSLNDDLLAIMEDSRTHVEKIFQEGSFRCLFWDQQLQAAKAKYARQMCWQSMHDQMMSEPEVALFSFISFTVYLRLSSECTHIA